MTLYNSKLPPDHVFGQLVTLDRCYSATRKNRFSSNVHQHVLKKIHFNKPGSKQFDFLFVFSKRETITVNIIVNI